MKLLGEEEQMAHLAAIVDSTDDAVLSKTLDGTVTSWNKGAERLYGYSAEEAVGRHVSFIVPQERLVELQEITEKIARGERVEHLETVRVAKDGRQISVSVTISPVLGAGGGIAGMSSIARDIGEQKRLENKLRESETRYRTLVEMAPDAVVVNQDGRFVYANCAALGIYGATQLEQLQHITLVDLVHPEERDALRSVIRQVLEGEEIHQRELRLLRLDGSEVEAEISVVSIHYQGQPSIQIHARDVSERKRAERERESALQELYFERARLETVVRQMPVGVIVVEAPSGKVVYDNEEARRISRHRDLSLDAVTDNGQPVYWIDASPLPVEEHPLARALKGETVLGEELEITRGDGTRGSVCVNATPIRDSSGRIVSAVVSFSDVTERKLAAQALIDSEQRLKLALDAAEMGSCDMSVATGRGVWSGRHFQLLGYELPQSGAGQAAIEMWQSRIHPDDLGRVKGELERAKQEGAFFRSEHRIIRVDNQQEVWVNVQGRFLCDEQRAACRFIGVIYDVSERKESEEALRRSERRFRLLSDSMPQIAWIAEPEGGIEYVTFLFGNILVWTAMNEISGSILPIPNS
jgi:PAS domain S-box-containing protein